MKFRFFVLIIGVLFGSLAHAQIIDDQKFISVKKEVADTDKVCEIVSQKLNAENAKLMAENRELKSMLANVGKSVQNETQRALLNRVYANYNAPSSSNRVVSSAMSRPRFDGASVAGLG
ncbi:MAG: hypothetical protein LKF33_06455 [Prevotella sp.]|nr:hypothetical protein [Prevotella sp.]